MSQSKQKVLIVDDTPDNIKLVATGLREIDVSLSYATDGDKALTALRCEPVDLILLDINMPGKDGYETAAEIKSDPELANIPIVFLTANVDQESIIKAFESGGVDYLAKPFNPRELIARVQTQLQIRGYTQRLEAIVEEKTKAIRASNEELQRINGALARFVPNEIFSALGYSHILDIRQGDHIQENMSVMFTDIRSFTSISEAMSPSDVFNFANEYHNRMTPLIRENKGFVQQFQGDGSLSIFSRSPADSVNAAISIQKGIDQYNREREEHGRIPIQVGIAIHYGPIMIGIIGDQERWEVGVPSDTVNTTSRIEALTKRYDASIIITSELLSGLEHPEEYHTRMLDKVAVYGREGAIALYEVFDNDVPEVKEKKLQTLDLFRRGQRHYYAREFSEAVKCFIDVLSLIPEDRVTRMFLQRSSQCLLEGVEASWQGIATQEK